MLLVAAEVLCAKSKHTFVSVGELGIYRFAYIRQLIAWQDGKIELNPAPSMPKRRALALAQLHGHWATGAPPQLMDLVLEY